jgi:pimeloyl-ACP methyl ester carboxylesterase
MARRIARVLLWLALGVCLVGVVAAVFFSVARSTRETWTPEQLAKGEGRWVPVSDLAMHIQEWGDPSRPTVVLTHGTGAWSGTWFSLPAALSRAGWHVVAVDLPPFGLTRMPSSEAAVDYTRSAQAKRLLQLIDTLRTPVVLVGHSFGAGPALESAVLGGLRVSQLVLVDPALGLGADGEPPQCDGNAGAGGLLALRPVRTLAVAATATWPGWTGSLLKQFVHRKAMVTAQLVPAYQVPFKRSGFSSSLGDWAVSFANGNCETAASLQPARLTAWSAAGPPVALVWGEEDTITPVVQGRALQSWMPNATLTVIPDVGHIPHIENADGFAKVLVSVLGRPGP